MSKYTLSISLLMLPLLAQAADQKKAPQKWVNVHTVFLLRDHDESRFVGLVIPVLIDNDHMTFGDLENAIIRFSHNKNAALLGSSNFGMDIQLADSSRVVYNQSYRDNCLSAITPRIPNIFKQLRNRELIGKPVRDTRKWHQ